jgi:Fe-S cluster assembly protein SufD
MAGLAVRDNSLIEGYSAVRTMLTASGPKDWAGIREQAFRSFEEAGIPTRKDEEFKYLPLHVLEEASFGPAYGATVSREEVPQLGDFGGFALAFLNGEPAPELGVLHALPEGVFVGTLLEAVEAIPDVVEAHLTKVATLTGKLGSTNDERFCALNTAHLADGAVVYVPRGSQLETPIHLQFLTKADHGAFAAYPRVLIVLEEGATAKVVESHQSLGGFYFNNGVTEVVLGQGAVLEHTRYQDESPEAVHISTVAIHQNADSVLTSNNVNFGGHLVRHDVNVWLDGEHTETWLNGAAVGLDEQVVDNHTRIDHAKPNCNSFEVYKSILGDRAVGVFNGKIFVYLDAQKTDAKQTNQAILLSPTATINTKPQLEIFADDVKCTHGATVGQLREDSMFYLRSRGIPEGQAKALLVYAFAAEVLEKISLVPLREALEAKLFVKLGTDVG